MNAIDEVICKPCLPLTMDVVVLFASGITAPSIQSEEIHITACAHTHIHCASSQMAHDAGTYPGFCSNKRLGVFLLIPGWDVNPSQGYPQHYFPVPIHTPEWREAQ